MVDFPVDFEALAREPAKPGGGSPLQIPANGLMKNYAMAALDVDPLWVESSTHKSGHASRKLKLPPAPGPGTFVLGCIDDTLQWIETESC
jgi:hypothetical protein